jgi:hypothetical protein
MGAMNVKHEGSGAGLQQKLNKLSPTQRAGSLAVGGIALGSYTCCGTIATIFMAQSVWGSDDQ